MDAVPHHFHRERDVGGDDEVATPGSLHDLIVRDVESRLTRTISMSGETGTRTG